MEAIYPEYACAARRAYNFPHFPFTTEATIMAPSIWQLLIVLLIVVMIFGTKKLKNIGSDLGGAVKGFKEGMREGSSDSSEQIAHKADADTIDVQAREAVKQES